MSHFIFDTNQGRPTQGQARPAQQPQRPQAIVDPEARQMIAHLAKQLEQVLAFQAKIVQAVNGTDTELRNFAKQAATAINQLQEIVKQLAVQGGTGVSVQAPAPGEAVIDGATGNVDPFVAPDEDDGVP